MIQNESPLKKSKTDGPAYAVLGDGLILARSIACPKSAFGVFATRSFSENEIVTAVIENKANIPGIGEPCGSLVKSNPFGNCVVLRDADSRSQVVRALRAVEAGDEIVLREEKPRRPQVGDTLRVYWRGEKQWFQGIVTRVDNAKKMTVHYDDGEIVDHDQDSFEEGDVIVVRPKEDEK